MRGIYAIHLNVAIPAHLTCQNEFRWPPSPARGGMLPPGGRARLSAKGTARPGVVFASRRGERRYFFGRSHALRAPFQNSLLPRRSGGRQRGLLPLHCLKRLSHHRKPIARKLERQLHPAGQAEAQEQLSLVR
jgi:hypothetical protein